MLTDDPTLLTVNFKEKMDKIMKSPLFECLHRMPKPVIHHLHMTAAVSCEFLLTLTYEDYVYFSEKDNNFKVTTKGVDEPGYMKVNTLR